MAAYLMAGPGAGGGWKRLRPSRVTGSMLELCVVMSKRLSRLPENGAAMARVRMPDALGEHFTDIFPHPIAIPAGHLALLDTITC